MNNLKCPNEKHEKWAINKFNLERKFMNIDFSMKIKDLLFKDFANLTSCFFLMLCKVNGNNYPIVSVMNMYNSFNRLLKVIYEKKFVNQILLN